MAILPVLTYPDPRLRTKAKPISEITSSIKTLIDDMIETMYQEEGIGLAATQVDQHIQLIVLDVSEESNDPKVLINPKLTAFSGETGIEEGCLSVPEYKAWVPRFAMVTVEAVDQNNNTVVFEADGLLAICLQHELDHLAGKLFVDYLSPLKRERLKKKIEKQLREN